MRKVYVVYVESVPGFPGGSCIDFGVILRDGVTEEQAAEIALEASRKEKERKGATPGSVTNVTKDALAPLGEIVEYGFLLV